MCLLPLHINIAKRGGIHFNHAEDTVKAGQNITVKIWDRDDGQRDRWLSLLF